MKQKKLVKFINFKHKIGSALIWIMLLAMAVFSLEAYADLIIGGTEREIANEKTMVRMTAELSRGSASDNKITLASLTSNLNRYAGTGTTTVTEQSTTILLVTFAKTGNQYEIDVNRGPLFEKIGITVPYIPVGYEQVEGTDLDTGFVIEDSDGNQYVWIEVPKTAEVYQTAGLNITQFTNTEYEKIEADLQTYTTTYRNGTSYVDEYYSDEATGLTRSEYNIQKKKMLKSVYKNGGFYVGRYETGIEDSYRTASGDATETPVIKQNAYPYNHVTTSQAQELSEGFATKGYTSSLMFGVQWDLVLKYIETKGAATTTELNSNSTNIGNYLDGSWSVTSETAKYSLDSGATYTATPYTKEVDEAVLLTTGANSVFCQMGIYDIAGNVWEKTLEYTSDSSKPSTFRGGANQIYGSFYTASCRRYGGVSSTDAAIGFRTTLYKDEGTRADGTSEELPYLPTGYTQVAGTDLDTGLVIADSLENQYVWVEVPRTSEVYSTAGLNVTEFTDEDYENIEADLLTYTEAYRTDENGKDVVDEYGSEETTGLTEIEYNTQKKKMLKSIYKNEGFYVGRYETGIDYTQGPRTDAGNISQTPVIKKNSYVYNYVTVSQAQDLSNSFARDGYTSSLMFNIQWDLVMKYLETTGTPQEEINVDSINWGNYRENIYNITNTTAKYVLNGGNTYTNTPYNKTEVSDVLLTTGASEKFNKQNIYDLAGNVYEWTLGNDDSDTYFAQRGNYYGESTIIYAASAHGMATPDDALNTRGFRVALYKDEGIGKDEQELPSYIPDGYAIVPGTEMETGLVIQDGSGNQYVWVEVPRTSTVYPTAGTNVTTFTSAEFAKIEADLHTYTTTYRNGTTHEDEYYSDELFGLTSAQYNAQKKKMLKSIYKNEGFYVGRYETGIDYSESPRTALGTASQTPVIKKNAYAYNYVTCTQAQTLASSFASTGYTSSMLFGVQWDLMLKYLEVKSVERGMTTADIQSLLTTSNSSKWGNYYDSTFNVTNRNSKYAVLSLSPVSLGSYSTAPYSKTSGQYILFTTGAEESFKKQEIYDIPGNALELTLETNDSKGTGRGGSFATASGTRPANNRLASDFTGGYTDSFRVALYTDEDVTATITYNANGGIGAPAAQTVTAMASTTLSTTVPTRSGYTFVGWNTDSSATSAQYSAGDTVEAEDMTLYAIWSQITYTVTFNANGGSGAPAAQTKAHGSDLTLSSTKPTKTGYTFQGWATTSTATTAAYSAGGTYSTDANATLYAVWKITTYTITYNANGGSGAPGNQTKTHGTNLTLSSTKPTKSGYIFMGWGTSASATTATYQPGGTYTANAAATLYAVWKQNLFTSSMLSGDDGAQVIWDGTTLKYNTSAYNSDTASQYIKIQAYSSAGLVINQGVAWSKKTDASITFTKESSLNEIQIRMNGDKADYSAKIDVSSLTNGTSYTLVFDVTEWGTYTATVTNIRIYK